MTRNAHHVTHRGLLACRVYYGGNTDHARTQSRNCCASKLTYGTPAMPSLPFH